MVLTRDVTLHAAAPGPRERQRPLLRFAVYAAVYMAVALLLAALGIVWFVREAEQSRAEQAVTFHTQFVADTIVRDRFRRSDFRREVTGARLAELDRLFRREVLVPGTLRVKLYGPSGMVTYSTDHEFIGTLGGESEVREALAGRQVRKVSRLNAEGGSGADRKVLEAYAPVRLLGDARPAGALELYQDYAPVELAARKAVTPVAIVLVLAMALLYVVFLPLLRRVTSALRRQNERLTEQARALEASLSERDGAEAKLREAEARYRTLVEQLPLVTYIDALTDTATSIYMSPQVEQLLGYPVAMWLEDPEFFAKVLHPDDRERVLAQVARSNAGESFSAEYRLVAHDGRTVWVQDESVVVYSETGEPLFTQGYLLDITERKRGEEALAAVVAGTATVTGDDFFKSLVRHLAQALGVRHALIGTLTEPGSTTIRTLAVWADNGHGENYEYDLAGTPCENVIGRGSFYCREGAAAIWPADRRLERLGIESCQGASIFDSGGESTGLVAVMHDEPRPMSAAAQSILRIFAARAGAEIERLRASEALWHQALHDSLTGLPNRTLFRDRVEQALLHARREGHMAAVMLIDLDRFKEVNDTLGHEKGDDLLRQVAQRLATLLRSTDTVARLGGDEFGILASAVAGAAGAQALADKLQWELAKPFELASLALSVEASIGIALYPEHGDEVETLLRKADVAMYVGKESHAPAFYSVEHDHYSPARLTLVGELREAIERGELDLYYQPQADLTSGEVRSVEALVRWQHPEHGLLVPEVFVPLAEHTGLIRPLTRFVLDRALAQCRAWRDEGVELAVAVNVSARDLLDVRLPDEVGELLRRWQIDPAWLQLEITETAILTDPVRARAVLDRLSELGVRLAIDDFGSGHSSLGYLKRLPIDVLKIDRSFVTRMAEDDNDAVIVRSTIDLGHNLGLEVVAEGVETGEIWDQLADLGCNTVQGYFLSRPVPAPALARWLAATAADRRSEPLAS